LKTAQLLNLKEPQAEATIPVLLPMLSGCDHKGSDKGSNKGAEDEGDAPDNDGNDDSGFNFLPNEEHDADDGDKDEDDSLLSPLIEMTFYGCDDKDSDDEDSIDEADNALKVDELEREIDDNDDG
jgi:hypothetical protein